MSVSDIDHHFFSFCPNRRDADAIQRMTISIKDWRSSPSNDKLCERIASSNFGRMLCQTKSPRVYQAKGEVSLGLLWKLVGR